MSGKPAPFVQNLWNVLHDDGVRSIIEWSGDDGFVVHKIDDFTEQILPRLCNSQSFCSFVRQLNGYGFSKKDPKRAYFQHNELNKRKLCGKLGIIVGPRKSCADSENSISTIRRRRTTKRRSDEPQDSSKHSAHSSSATSGATAPQHRVKASSSRPHHPVHHVAKGHPNSRHSQQSRTEHVHSSQRAGHEGEQRPLLLSSLITLKQIVSAALSARAFGHAPSSAPSGLESLLLSTVQHSVANLLQSHRPDLLPAVHGPTPRLAVLDVVLGQLLMELSGGEDADHMVSTATHGPASHSYMDAAASHPPPRGPGPVPAPVLPQPTYAAPAPVDMQPHRLEHTPRAQHAHAMHSLPAHSTALSTAYTTASSSHTSQLGGEAGEAASVSTGHGTGHAPTPPASTAEPHQERKVATHVAAADSAERHEQLHAAWQRMQTAQQAEAAAAPHALSHAKHPPAAAQEHQYLAPYAPASDPFDLSSLPDDDDIQKGREGLDAALRAAGVGPDLG